MWEGKDISGNPLILVLPTMWGILLVRSVNDDIIYKYLVSDGISKAHNLILEVQPYGKTNKGEKNDCIGHVQKGMETALRNLKTKKHGEKLSDGQDHWWSKALDRHSLITIMETPYKIIKFVHAHLERVGTVR